MYTRFPRAASGAVLRETCGRNPKFRRVRLHLGLFVLLQSVCCYHITGGARHGGRAVAQATDGIETIKESSEMMSTCRKSGSDTVQYGTVRRANSQIGQELSELGVWCGACSECSPHGSAVCSQQCSWGPCNAGMITKANR